MEPRKSLQEYFDAYKNDPDSHIKDPNERECWIKGYKDFYERIHQHNEITDELLEELFLQDENRITRYGQSTLRKEKYEQFRGDKEFRRLINQFYTNNDRNNYELLLRYTQNKCDSLGIKRIPLRVKRVACAFNINLSIFCSADFDKAVESMSGWRIFTYRNEKSWYKKNIDFTKCLDKELGYVTGDDRFYRNTFLWRFYYNEIKKSDEKTSGSAIKRAW